MKTLSFVTAFASDRPGGPSECRQIGADFSRSFLRSIAAITVSTAPIFYALQSKACPKHS